MRTPMVTRTIKATKVTVMAVDTTKGEIVNLDFTLARTYKDDAAILKALPNQVEIPENIKVVSVVSTEITEAKYGMTESEFINHANKI